MRLRKFWTWPGAITRTRLRTKTIIPSKWPTAHSRTCSSYRKGTQHHWVRTNNRPKTRDSSASHLVYQQGAMDFCIFPLEIRHYSHLNGKHISNSLRDWSCHWVWASAQRPSKTATTPTWKLTARCRTACFTIARALWSSQAPAQAALRRWSSLDFPFRKCFGHFLVTKNSTRICCSTQFMLSLREGDPFHGTRQPQNWG